MMSVPEFATIAAILREAGFAVRGGFHPSDSDGVPALSSGAAPRTLILAGNVGPGMWRAFISKYPVESRDNEGHPTALDDWSRDILHGVVSRLGGPDVCTPLFPSDGPPFLPFTRWAMKAEPVFPSPIGPLIHPDYGLWHAYRGALAFEGNISLPETNKGSSPCETCEDKPCLGGCPVAAHRDNAFDLAGCTAHIVAESGRECMAGGCLARRACPIGRDFMYDYNQARFHMVSFRRANRVTG